MALYANSGAITIEFGIEAGSAEGSITSDVSGNVTAISEFLNLSLINYSNLTEADYRLFINGDNGVLYETLPIFNQLEENDVGNNQIAGNWMLSVANPIPEPSSALLLGFGGLSLLLRRFH